MKDSEEKLSLVERALREAHRRPEDLEVPSDWRPKLMQDIRALARPAPVTRAPRRRLAWAGAAMAVILGGLILANLDWYDPWITIKSNISFVGARAEVLVEAGDQDSGIRSLRVSVIQAGREVHVLSREVKHPERFLGFLGATVKKVEIALVLDAKALNLLPGPAKLMIEAYDLSWRNNFRGRLTTLERNIDINLTSAF
jgi:hypothetical protein